MMVRTHYSHLSDFFVVIITGDGLNLLYSYLFDETLVCRIRYNTVVFFTARRNLLFERFIFFLLLKITRIKKNFFSPCENYKEKNNVLKTFFFSCEHCKKKMFFFEDIYS